MRHQTAKNRRHGIFFFICQRDKIMYKTHPTCMRLMYVTAIMFLLSPASFAQTICTFDIGGTSGDFFVYLKDYQLAAKNWGIKELSFKIYKSESEAINDFRSGICDGVAATGYATREFNNFTGTINAIGAIPSNSIAKTVVSLMANPKLAEDMVQGHHEVAGVIPVGSAYFVLKDRSINTLEKAEGKRVGVLEIDPSQAQMIKKVGGKPVFVSYNDGVRRFREGEVDILPAPAVAFEALEIYRAMGSKGGIVRFPISFMTATIVVNRDNFPAGYGQKSREWVVSKASVAMNTILNYEKAVPSQYWVNIPPADQVGYIRLMRQMRLEFIANKTYNKKMISLLKKLRCQQDSSSYECSLEGE